MKKIELTQGKYALVDDEDYDRVNQYKWYAANHGNNKFYAGSNTLDISKRRFMHRFIMNLQDKSLVVDHINGNGLDNRKCNLRICSHRENIRNQKLHRDSTTGFKGVTIDNSQRRKKKYKARIIHNYKQIVIGHFMTAQEAANAYNDKAKELFGEFAKLNEVI